MMVRCWDCHNDFEVENNVVALEEKRRIVAELERHALVLSQTGCPSLKYQAFLNVIDFVKHV